MASAQASTPAAATASSSYVCDTIPAARLATSDTPAEDLPADDTDDVHTIVDNDEPSSEQLPALEEPTIPPPPRKLCVRHQRMADEGTNVKLQQSLDALPVEEREVVSSIWSNFSSSPHPRRALILNGLLTMCCFSQLSLLTEQLQHLIRIDPFSVFPREVSLKVLGYLDATSLCRAAQVTKKWRELADDDILWRGICEQHIGQKCHKCGWGLPVLEKKRKYHLQSPSPAPTSDNSCTKRPAEEAPEASSSQPKKRLRSENAPYLDSLPEATSSSSPPSGPATPGNAASWSSSSACRLLTQQPDPLIQTATRPWKDVYSERMTVERNWRRGRYQTRTFKGHKDGVMCLQFSESFSHPSFPILISGSYDRTARVWNFETGAELHCLQGHTRVVRCLQFDEVKLITGSMDNTMRVWDWRRGKCIRILQGHTEGVLSLHFDNNVLASGSVDGTVKVWNLRTGGAFTLRGHSDWVNSVQLWDTQRKPASSSASSSSVFDVPGCAAPQIDPGKMLFSASDDGTIRLWDLTLRTCIRQFTGHMGQVQSMKLLLTDECEEGESSMDVQESGSQSSALSDEVSSDLLSSKGKKPLLISGSLDNTIKIWDLDTGKAVQTLFGHIEGVWGVASDQMRLVSASHDRTIKVWSREEGRCTLTLIGHTAAVSCVALGEDKIVSGSDDCDIKVWSFSE